jgi:hypothetical protein
MPAPPVSAKQLHDGIMNHVGFNILKLFRGDVDIENHLARSGWKKP